MNNFNEYDITALYPGSMRACSKRDAGALWSYSQFDKSMGLFFSCLNNCWILDSAIYGDDRNDLFLIPARVTDQEAPEQYVVASETTLRQTFDMLIAHQSCIWEACEFEPGYIVQFYAKDHAPEGNLCIGELSSSLASIPSDEEQQRVRDILKRTGLPYYLIGKLSNSQVFLYLFRRDAADASESISGPPAE